jgi:hypothetical protein
LEHAVAGEKVQPFRNNPEEALDFIGAILSDIVKQVDVALEPRPSRVVHVNAGYQVPWDDICPGQLAGRVLTITPFTGKGGATSHPCGITEYIATLGVGLVRCVSVVNDDGIIPSADEMLRDGLQQTRDLANMLRVIQCHPEVRTIGAFTPSAVRGGAVEIEWTFQVRVPVCQCVEDGQGFYPILSRT